MSEWESAKWSEDRKVNMWRWKNYKIVHYDYRNNGRTRKETFRVYYIPSFFQNWGNNLPNDEKQDHDSLAFCQELAENYEEKHPSTPAMIKKADKSWALITRHMITLKGS